MLPTMGKYVVEFILASLYKQILKRTPYDPSHYSQCHLAIMSLGSYASCLLTPPNVSGFPLFLDNDQSYDIAHKGLSGWALPSLLLPPLFCCLKDISMGSFLDHIFFTLFPWLTPANLRVSFISQFKNSFLIFEHKFSYTAKPAFKEVVAFYISIGPFLFSRSYTWISIYTFYMCILINSIPVPCPAKDKLQEMWEHVNFYTQRTSVGSRVVGTY